jgi:hypothetical protein
MGTSDEDPNRPSWSMPDALEERITEFEDSARRSIRSNWRALSFKQRNSFWQQLTGLRLPRTRRKRALLIAEILLGSRGSADEDEP